MTISACQAARQEGLPARLFPLCGCHGPQLILEALNVLLLDRDQFLPVIEKVEV